MEFEQVSPGIYTADRDGWKVTKVLLNPLFVRVPTKCIYSYIAIKDGKKCVASSEAAIIAKMEAHKQTALL